MSNETPPPGVDGYSQDPLRQYPHEDTYGDWRRATREARRTQRHMNMRVEAEKQLQATRKPYISPEYVWCLSFGLMTLGVAVIAITFLSLDVATLPLGLALPLLAFGSIGIIRDIRKNR